LVKPPVPTITHQRSLELRQAATDAERKLWLHLRASRLNGYKFRRQHPIPPYVVDFYCDALALVVELDGSQHNAESDAMRTKALEDAGLRVVRFWNDEVLKNTQAVLDAILNIAENRTLSPTPLPEGEGLKSYAQ
jgi:very-short-patch-repair endonuclease